MIKSLSVNFDKNCGRVKPMHAVNNGPVYKFNVDMRITNMDAWKEAGIPYARTHDSPFCNTYGGPHIVDVALIFTDFDADPYLAESYDFACTDEYLRIINFAGTKVFYRLGASIEHYVKKYHTLPPKDFKKWAIICEHIIKHYTEGWADGFYYDIEYWEIWNEPDLDADDAPNKRTWGGTTSQFFDLYEIAAKHLKTQFPKLKIGGPSLAYRMDWAEDFLKEMSRRNVSIDFFSWHKYSKDPNDVVEMGELLSELLTKYGYDNAESILNEWNYVRGWTSDEYIYTINSIKNLKGASFVLGTMCACQYSSTDMLMYYDARPGSGFNGMFDANLVCNNLKGYYPFKMFNELYKLGTSYDVTSDEHLFACAAAEGDKAAIVFTHFCDDDSTPASDVKITIQGFEGEHGIKAACFLLDENNNLELVKEEILCGGNDSITLKSTLYSNYLVMLEKI